MTRTDRLFGLLKNNKLISAVIIIGSIVIAIGSFADALTKMLGLLPQEEPEIRLVFGTAEVHQFNNWGFEADAKPTAEDRVLSFVDNRARDEWLDASSLGNAGDLVLRQEVTNPSKFEIRIKSVEIITENWREVPKDLTLTKSRPLSPLELVLDASVEEYHCLISSQDSVHQVLMKNPKRYTKIKPKGTEVIDISVGSATKGMTDIKLQVVWTSHGKDLKYTSPIITSAVFTHYPSD